MNATTGILLAVMAGAALADNWDASAPGGNVLPGNAASKLVVGSTTAQDKSLTVVGSLGVYSSNVGISLKNTASSNKVWELFSSGNNLNFNESGVGTRMTFFAGGDVGIGGGPLAGTVASQRKLTITTPQSATAEYANLEIQGKMQGGANSNFAGINFNNAATRAAAISAGRDGDDKKGKLILSVNNGTSLQDALLINSNNFVGIGNVNPTANLHVGTNAPNYVFKLGGQFSGGSGITFWNGSDVGATVSAANKADGGFLIYENQDCGTGNANGCMRSFDIGARDYANTGGGGTRIRFFTSNLAASAAAEGTQLAQERMVIDRGGNVGIGVAKPGATFHVKGSTRLDGDVVLGTASLGAVNSQRKLTLSTPQSATLEYANLEIQGRVTGSDANFGGINFNNAAVRSVAISAGRDGADNKGKLIFSTSSGTTLQDVMSISSSGNVGIGTGPTAFKLDVNGTANISGELTVASVKTKVWSVAPDYVFEKGYDLASLDKVKSYIDKNKHLPEIPSAREIKEKGIDLAEMNMKLLGKVEELTLYAILQNKKIETLTSRLDSMQGRK